VEGEVYMRLPKGFKLDQNRNRNTHILKLLKYIHGLEPAGRVWNLHLHKGLTELKYKLWKVYPCLYYQQGIILTVYIDDCSILVSKGKTSMENAIKELAIKFE